MIRRLAAALLVFGLAASASMMLVVSTGAQDDRAHQVGKKLKCMCGGCNDTAATCYHVGGAFSGPCDTAKGMLKKIDQQVARGDSDDFRVAWAMPLSYLVLGGILVVFVINRWRKRPAPAAQTAGATSAAGISPERLEHARQRVAQETED